MNSAAYSCDHRLVRGWSPPKQSRRETLTNEIRELNSDELDAVSGGMQNLANLPGFHPAIRVNPGSPLYGNSSFHDTIDNTDGLP
jgi:hypothetical protein